MGMVERVARAMIANDSGPEGSVLFEIHLREFGDGYRSSARAAIAAMREPTPEMVMALRHSVAVNGYGAHGAPLAITEVIKAALGDRP